MPFIGNTPDVNFTSFAKQDLTGVTGSPAKRGFTLTHAVANANEIEVFVNNVRQEPTEAYTVNGTGLTMTGDVETTDDFYIIYLGKAIQTTVPPDGSVSTAKIASSAVNLTSKVTGVLPVANGGTGATSFVETNSVIETWYYNDDNTTAHNNAEDLYAGYTRLTSQNTATKNEGMAHATAAGTNGTGIWTFPSTGIWRIELVLKFYHSGGASTNTGVKMLVTTNNNTYGVVDAAYHQGYTTNANSTIILPYTLNVNNISNVKFKHSLVTNGAIVVRGGTSDHFATKIHFIKLCPSV
jgi:hypothetical protein